MRLKRYLVNDMKEAMELIKRELGPDAVLISSKKIRRPGLIGFFLTPQFEVTAAVDDVIQTTAPVLYQENSSLQKELVEIKGMLRQATLEKRLECESDELERWKNLLLELEINKETIAQLLENIKKDLELDGAKVLDARLVTDSLAELLPAAVNSSERGTYCFLGPTGVGKTTTLAKLAAQAVFQKGRSVGLITIDTYRIGAVEQLRIYADIMDVPLKVVMSPEELKQALKDFEEKELIFIDTAGRPFDNNLQISELKSFLQDVQLAEKYLVLSSNMKEKDLLRVAENFNTINFTGLIFTKLDETSTLGSIVNVAHKLGKPVAYVTNGQNVPDDIQGVDAGKLSEIIVKAVG